MSCSPNKNCCKLKWFEPVTHVIFDLDGTLIDSEHVYVDAMNSIANEYGKKVTDEIVCKIAGSSQHDTAKIFLECLNIPMTPEEFLTKYRAICKEILPDVDLMPGADTFVRHLHKHNVPIAIATSSPEDEMLLKMSKKADFLCLFHHVVCGSTDPEVKFGKPAPDIFLVCASRFYDKPQPEKCLVIEDSVNGVKGAISAGMQVVMIPAESVPYEMWKLATVRMDSFDYLMPELFGLPSYNEEEEKVEVEVLPKNSDAVNVRFTNKWDSEDSGSEIHVLKGSNLSDVMSTEGSLDQRK